MALSTVAILLALATVEEADAEGPPLEVDLPEEGLLTNSTTLTVTGSTAPDVGDVNVTTTDRDGTVLESYSLLDGDLELDAGGEFSLEVDLHEGTQALNVTATDTEGNASAFETWISVDTTPPVVEFIAPSASPIYTNDEMILIHFRVEGSTIWPAEPRVWVWNGTDWQRGGGVLSRMVPLVEGENLIEVRARDELWNIAIASVIVIRDTVPPVLTVTEPTAAEVVTDNRTIRLAGTVEGADILDITEAGYTQPITFSENGSWEHTFEFSVDAFDTTVEVRARDSAGNQDIHHLHLLYDFMKPTLVIESVPPWTSESTLQMNGTTDLDIDEVIVNGARHPVVSGTFSVTLELVPHARNSVYFYVNDPAGNSNLEWVYVTHIDRPPVLEYEWFWLFNDVIWIEGRTETYIDTAYVDGEPCRVTNGNFSTSMDVGNWQDPIELRVTDEAGQTTTDTFDPNGLLGLKPTTRSWFLFFLLLVLTVIAAVITLLRKIGERSRVNPPNPDN